MGHPGAVEQADAAIVHLAAMIALRMHHDDVRCCHELMGHAVTGLTRADYLPGAHLSEPIGADSLGAVLRVHHVEVPCYDELVIHTVADMTRDEYLQAVGVLENAMVDSLTLATAEAGCTARSCADWLL